MVIHHALEKDTLTTGRGKNNTCIYVPRYYFTAVLQAYKVDFCISKVLRKSQGTPKDHTRRKTLKSQTPRNNDNSQRRDMQGKTTTEKGHVRRAAKLDPAQQKRQSKKMLHSWRL